MQLTRVIWKETFTQEKQKKNGGEKVEEQELFGARKL